jgi:serine/threonine protein kinase
MARRRTIERELSSLGFTDISEIGEGAFGRVYCALSKEGKRICLKAISLAKTTFEEVEHEKSVMLSLNHPNCISIDNFWETADRYYYIQMMYCLDGTLDQQLCSGSFICILSF